MSCRIWVSSVAASVLLHGAADVTRTPMERTGTGIQRAIDEVCAAGGGRVLLEKSVYPSGTLYLKSNVELHVPAGSVILGGDCAADYDDVVDARIGKRPEKSDRAFVVSLFQTNVSITGHGVIDGRGAKFYDTTKRKWGMYAKPDSPRPRMVEFVGCRNVRFEDVTFKDSPGWTCWIRMCEGFVADRVTICADQLMVNNDGFHIDGCRHVRIRHCDVRTGDDSIVMRAIRSPNGDSSLCEDVLVEDCSLNSHCQCIRLGCPSDGTIRNGTFRRLKMKGFNGVVSAHPVAYLQDGDSGSCRMENLLVECCDIVAENFAIALWVDPGISLGSFGNMTFRDVRLEGNKPLTLKGSGNSVLENMVFERVSGVVAAPFPLDVCSVSNLVFKDFSVVSGSGERNAPAINESDSWERVP